MNIGLTRKELGKEWGEAMDTRMKNSHIELLLNAKTQAQVDQIQAQYGLPDIQSIREACTVMAILDTIAKNNEAIGKSISQ